MLPIDEEMPAALQMPAKHGKLRQRLLRDDPQLIRERRENDRRVVDALMIRDEDVGRARDDALEALERHADAGGLENQPRPRAGAAVRKVTAPVEQARDDRDRTEDDRIDGDGGKEKHDGTAPGVGG